MQVINRINLPKAADVASLYIHCNEAATINYHNSGQEVVCRQGGIISSNSYFNSFYESYYAKYTNLGSIYYLLRLEGDFEVAVYREVYGSNQRELLSHETFERSELYNYVKVSLPNLQQKDNPQGRIYFELVCLSEQGVFQEGLIATEQQPNQEVSLAIITCTFRKEAYIKKTINTILQDQLLQAKKFEIFVVDNGKTLNAKDFTNLRLKLIPNKNVGGSGGFNRGLLTALQANTYSHFLFMDDDIELDSESIYRLFALNEYAKRDFAVASGMIDLYKKHTLHEAGSVHNKNHLYFSAALKHNLDLQNPTSLNLLLLEDHIDFGGFWFFSFSKKLIEKIGLLMPLFIKVDDIEFCLRINESVDSKIVAFPSIAVWHEPFYAKVVVWDTYYNYRNHLITNTIHGSLDYTNILKEKTKEVILKLFLFEYNYVEMMVKAFEDYIKGPDFLKTNDPEVLHSNIVALSQSYKTQNVQRNDLPPTNLAHPRTRASIWKKIVSLLTLNGHLLPNFLIKDDDVFFWQNHENAGQLSRAFAKKQVLIYREGVPYLFKNEIDKKAGIKLLARWVKVAAISSVKWSSISREWQKAANDLTSITFWQQYLGLKE